MGKTVPSYRLALEEEIGRWKGFTEALRSDEREVFEQLMDACRSYASAGSNSTRPVMFEPMAMSIMLSQQTKIIKLQKALDAVKQCSCQPPEG